MVADMTEVVDAPAFPVPVAELPDFFPAVMDGDLPDALMTELQSGIRRGNLQRNQDDKPVPIHCPVSSKKQPLHFLYFHLRKQFLKI